MHLLFLLRFQGGAALHTVFIARFVGCLAFGADYRSGSVGGLGLPEAQVGHMEWRRRAGAALRTGRLLVNKHIQRVQDLVAQAGLHERTSTSSKHQRPEDRDEEAN